MSHQPIEKLLTDFVNAHANRRDGENEVSRNVTLRLKALPGERVRIPELEQKATVRSISVNQGGSVQYEIHYFANGERKSAYLFADEFLVIDQ